MPVASTAGDEPLDRQAAALALAERITGERLTEEWLLDTNHVRLLVSTGERRGSLAGEAG
ncbi:DUF6461 domain-containing protein [Microbispora rosea]|uniref:DUF6461 domain-containing protein n=1 Tax=Microbispora rosea TaxID=58117 RepID=UPI0004C3B1B4